MNYINTDGKVLSPDIWFDSVDGFRQGFAAVSLNNEENFIDTEGNLLSPHKWFSSVFDFENGFAKVYMDNKKYFLDRSGNLLDYETQEKLMNVKDLKESRKPKMIVTESQLRELIKRELKNIKG